MKKIVLYALTFFLSFKLISCDNDAKEELDALQAELMVLHDEVMPKSLRIDKLRSQLSAYADSVEAGDSLKVLIIDTSMKLGKANDDMYLWMENFGKAMNETPDLTEKKELYDGLLPEIKRIATETDENIEKAKQILGS